MLILFDIDATLITTGGVGVAAMLDAGRALHGPAFHADGIDFAGRLDPLILADLLALNRVECRPAGLAAMRAAYREALIRRLEPAGISRALPGVFDLLASLGALGDRVTLGLLTGNFAETGSLKLQAAGLDPEGFAIRVWGDESPHDPPARDHLPGIALERATARWGRPARPQEAVVIGDTPHDIACARAHGCRVLAVATGKYAAPQLAHADHVVADLSDVQGVLRWLTG